MIGAFARMLGSQHRVLTVEETAEHGYAVTARGPTGDETLAPQDDAPPAAFVERVPTEAGDVYLIPFMDALRHWIKKAKPTVSSTSPKKDETPYEPEEE